ncbi:MAG: 2-oxoacid:ferredoxin oxidoreductase subunit beta [Nitrospinota bacterium]
MSTETKKLTRKEFASDQIVRWCPGCGDYAILAQVQSVFPDVGVPREKIAFISGIGCAARFPYYMNTYGFHSIHGRAPAVATGLKAVNPELSVWVVTGDGDALSIGGNHLLHVLRRNVDVKILLFNNRIYGLTKGQYSPTSEFGKRTKSTPLGSVDTPLNPVSVALGAEATFVARTVDRDVKHMREILRKAAAHKGTAFVEILQNCPVFNDGAFFELTEKETKDIAGIHLEEGEPAVFGPQDNKQGLRLNGLKLEAVPLDGDAGGVIVHDPTPEDPTLAFMIGQMHHHGLPVALGVLRAVERPCYETLVNEQIHQAVQAKGEGSLEALLNEGDTWTVD